jgi:sugar phosphate isomerase/epimerase
VNTETASAQRTSVAPRRVPRRAFLVALPLAGAVAAGWSPGPRAAANQGQGLERALGVTTGSFVRHLATQPAAGKLVLLDLPTIMRDELDLRVLDLMTATLPSLEPAYCERLRGAAERARCVITNLKMNQRDLDMASADPARRRHALDTYRATIDAAARLGCRWVRPLPGNERPELPRLVSAFRELIDYAAPKGITLLIENNGWLRGDPDGIPRVIQAVGRGLAAQPDTGNWTDAARYEGLEKAFAHAATCDFKALRLGPGGEHADYDLRRCFDIAWRSGFRGPWCFEHFHDDLATLFQDMKLLRDLLRRWMAQADNP